MNGIFKKHLIKVATLVVFAATMFSLSGCEFAQSLLELQRLQFKLKNVDNFKVNGISVQSKKNLSDFSVSDGMKLTRMYAQKKFPVDFNLNVIAKNPNQNDAASQPINATITRFDWVLLIDDKETISGGIGSPVRVPDRGGEAIIPLVMSLDLYDFFASKSYDGLINLALAIGGQNGSTSRLKLKARPGVQTPYGNIDYPGEITIVDTQFN